MTSRQDPKVLSSMNYHFLLLDALGCFSAQVPSAKSLDYYVRLQHSLITVTYPCHSIDRIPNEVAIIIFRLT
jgi:hypothetical protein